MPIYEFHCVDCDHSFETLVRFGHDEDAACPACHGDHLYRELSVVAAGRNHSEGSSRALASTASRGGGCCGGGCGCH